jgi:hypothetical protein
MAKAVFEDSRIIIESLSIVRIWTVAPTLLQSIAMRDSEEQLSRMDDSVVINELHSNDQQPDP